MNTQPTLLDLFNEYFQVILADTPETLSECYRVRYQVYCEEGLIPGFHAKDYPEGMEYDHYDQHSAHCLLMHKPTGRVAGTVRIILPALDREGFKFPLEQHAAKDFFKDKVAVEKLPRPHLGEISRLILTREFRGRKGENNKPCGLADDFETSLKTNKPQQSTGSPPDSEQHPHTIRRAFPHAILGLFVAILKITAEKNLTYWYGGMEPVCARFLRTFGVNFVTISPLIDYYGPCKSYLGYIPDMINHIYQTNEQIWALLTNNGAIPIGHHHLGPN